jgi:hypothetical protein
MMEKQLDKWIKEQHKIADVVNDLIHSLRLLNSQIAYNSGASTFLRNATGSKQAKQESLEQLLELLQQAHLRVKEDMKEYNQFYSRLNSKINRMKKRQEARYEKE